MDDIEFHKQQLEKARQRGDLRAQADHLGAIGNLRGAAGDISGGIQDLQEQLKIRLDTGDNDRAALSCKNLAAHYDLGEQDWETALQYAELGAKLAESDFRRKELNGIATMMRRQLGRE